MTSSTGRKYYLLLTGPEPVVAAGYLVALTLNGGNWLKNGKIPEGFATLEAACNAGAEKGFKGVRVQWTAIEEDVSDPSNAPDSNLFKA